MIGGRWESRSSPPGRARRGCARRPCIDISHQYKMLSSRKAKSEAIRNARGWMEKLGGFIQSWRQRYWVIQSGHLTYFESPEHVDQGKSKGDIRIKGAMLSRIPARKYDREHVFGMQPQGVRRTYILQAPNSRELAKWISVLVMCGAVDRDAQSLSGSGSARMVHGSIREGWLQKKVGKVVKEWGRRFFVLTEKNLMWYLKHDRSTQPRNSIPLVGARLRIEPPEDGEAYVFSIRPLSVTKKYWIATESKSKLSNWISDLETLIGRKAERGMSPRATRGTSAALGSARTAGVLGRSEPSGPSSLFASESPLGPSTLSTMPNEGIVLKAGSNKGVLLTKGTLVEGCQVWTDKACVYSQVPQHVSGGYVVRMPQRLPKGTVLSFETSRMCLVYLLLAPPPRDGGLIDVMTAAHQRGRWQVDEKLSLRIIGANWNERIITLTKALGSGTHALPATRTDETMAALIFCDAQHRTCAPPRPPRRRQDSVASTTRVRGCSEGSAADGKRTRRKRGAARRRGHRRTRSGNAPRVSDGDDDDGEGTSDDGSTSDSSKSSSSSQNSRPASRESSPSLAARGSRGRKRAARARPGRAPRPAEPPGEKASLKEKIIYYADGDTEKWVQLKNLSSMLRKAQITPGGYFHHFLLLFGADKCKILFGDVIKVAPRSQKPALSEAFAEYKRSGTIKSDRSESARTSEPPSIPKHHLRPRFSEPSARARSSEPRGPNTTDPNKKTPQHVKSRFLRRLNSLRTRELEEAKEQKERADNADTMAAHVNSWLIQHDKDIILLLAHLDEIFPEGVEPGAYDVREKNRKADSLTEVVANVRRAFRRALLKVHPDKVRGLSVPQKVRAEEVYQGLTKAYKKFVKRIEQAEADAAA